MYKLLISEIDNDDVSLLNAFTIIEEFMFEPVTHGLTELTSIVEQCKSAVEKVENPLEKAEVLINELFVEQLLIDSMKKVWPVLSFKLNSGTEYRLLSPALKAVCIMHIANACDLESDIVFVPEKLMVRIVCDDTYAIIFDPIDGESLDWQQFEQRMEDIDGDPSEFSLLPVDRRVLITEHFTALKNALINEGQFDNALKCVDILIALRPNDPFERRDRGFLLHQLDCFKVAYDDYQYFVEHCPKDPAAQLLKLQLDNIKLVDTVLH